MPKSLRKSSPFVFLLSASALANLWERSTHGRDRVGADATFRRLVSSVGCDVLQFIVFEEFGPDIKKIFQR